MIEDYESLKWQLQNVNREKAVIQNKVDELGDKITETDLNRTKVFISYTRSDEEWAERLRTYLRPLVHENIVEIWDDTRITNGKTLWEEMKHALSEARVVVPLVSPDFFHAGFVTKEELPYLNGIEGHNITVLPVIIKSLDFNHTELGSFTPVNPPDKPLAGMTPREQTEIFYKLEKAIKEPLVSQRLASKLSNLEIQQSNIEGKLEVLATNPTAQPARTKLLLICNYHDKKWLEKLSVHVKWVAPTALVEMWDERNPEVNQQWRDAMKKSINSAKVVVYVVSPDSLTIDHIATQELQPMLEEAKEDGARILIVPVEPTKAEIMGFDKFEWLNPPIKALGSMSKDNQDAYLNDLTYPIERALNS
jgi:predicted nucleotide-binding protein